MQTGQLLANIMGITRQAVHAHFQSGSQDHAAWFTARVVDNLTKSIHFHDGIAPEARAVLVRGRVAAMATLWDSLVASWGQFETTLRNGARVIRKRDTEAALKALGAMLGLEGDGWVRRMLRVALRSLKENLAQWVATGDWHVTVPLRQAMRALIESPGFFLLWDPL